MVDKQYNNHYTPKNKINIRVTYNPLISSMWNYESNSYFLLNKTEKTFGLLLRAYN